MRVSEKNIKRNEQLARQCTALIPIMRLCENIVFDVFRTCCLGNDDIFMCVNRYKYNIMKFVNFLKYPC